MKNCPKCDEPMFVMEYDRVELDICDECGGVWLDAGELELILGEGGGSAEEVNLGDAGRAKGEDLLDCPVCVAKLTKGTYGSTDVVVDRCPYNDGIFLDKGELDAIRDHYTTHSEATDNTEDLAGRALGTFFSRGEPSAQDAAAHGKE